MEEAGAVRQVRAVHVSSPVEEFFNALTHGLGAVLALVALLVLVQAALSVGDHWYVVAFSIFGGSMIFLYLASTLYHAVSHAKTKRVFEVFDHIGIYILIAGSYTAFTLTLLRDGPGWMVFGLIWTIAAVGIVIESLFLNRWPLLSTIMYVAMGWLIVLFWEPLCAVARPEVPVFLIAGGLAYTIGAVIYQLGRSRPWFHIVWHLFVLGGTMCHFFAALYTV